jgi:hypothetical protein
MTHQRHNDAPSSLHVSSQVGSRLEMGYEIFTGEGHATLQDRCLVMIVEPTLSDSHVNNFRLSGDGDLNLSCWSHSRVTHISSLNAAAHSHGVT